jgi:hypothetical protein
MTGRFRMQARMAMALYRRLRSTAWRATARSSPAPLPPRHRARRRGRRFSPAGEVPIEWHYRRESQIHLLRDGYWMFHELMRIRARAREGEYERPLGAR